MRHLKSDAKIDRIVVSWLQPTRGDATWLAAVADEVSLPPGPAPRNGRFCYIALDRASGARTAERRWADPDATGSRTMLVIDDRHRHEAARRIPALDHIWNPGPHDVEAPDHAVVTLHPVEQPRRGRRHHG